MPMHRRWFVVGSLFALLLGVVSLPQAQPRAGGTLRIAHPGDMTFFNVNQGPAPGYNTLWVWNNIFNGLLTMTPPPELKIVPDLARSWEVLDNGQTYVFQLVQDVKFHDGTEFDATAAKWNIDRILDPEVKSWVRPYYEDIETVEVVDKHTLRVRMKKPFGGFPVALAGYFQGIPMASPKSYATYGKEWIRHPSGTGPFKLKELVAGKHVILEKNPEYFKKGLPYLDTLEFRIMKDPQTATTALRTGEIDFVSRVPVKLVPLLEKSPKVKVLTGPEMAPTVAFLNMRHKPFDDVRARRAVGGFGIDRAEIAKVAFQGRTKPLVSVLAPGVQGAIDLNELYPYSPEKSKQLLKELGFDEKNPLQLSILVGNHDATLADIATLVKNHMAKIGVDAKINLVDATTQVDRVLVKHDFEMVISSWGSLIDINMRSVSFFKGMQSDYMGIDDANLEAMVYKWRESLDPAVRDRISADMQRLIAEQLYWVNVSGYPFFQAYRDNVKDFPFYDQAYFFMEKAWLDK
jgi:peptide/nickel transport system substrate-binding protein